MTANPIEILTEARKAVPALDYALGVAGVAAAGGLIVGLTGNGRAAIAIVGLVLVGMVMLFIFASLVKSGSRAARSAGTILIWAVLAFFVVFLGFTVSVVAVGQPCRWGLLLGLTDECTDLTVPGVFDGMPLIDAQRLPGFVTPVLVVNGWIKRGDPITTHEISDYRPSGFSFQIQAGSNRITDYNLTIVQLVDDIECARVILSGSSSHAPSDETMNSTPEMRNVMTGGSQISGSVVQVFIDPQICR